MGSVIKNSLANEEDMGLILDLGNNKKLLFFFLIMQRYPGQDMK